MKVDPCRAQAQWCLVVIPNHIFSNHSIRVKENESVFRKMVTHNQILAKTPKVKNPKSVHEVVKNKTHYQELSSPAGEL